MKLLASTGRQDDVKWKKITVQQQKVMKKTKDAKKTHPFFVISFVRGFCSSKLAVTSTAVGLALLNRYKSEENNWVIF
jgi:hypothetical protein